MTLRAPIRRMDLAVGIVAVLVLVVGMAASAQGRTINGDAVDARFGDTVASVGDYDADLVGDLAIGQPNAEVAGNNKVGAVRVFSTGTTDELFSVVGEAQGDRFGTSVAGIEDVNGDTIPDLLVGAVGVNIMVPREGPFPPKEVLDVGRVYVVSGADGSFLAAGDGSEPSEAHGKAVVSLGDVDSDGLPDFAVGSRLGQDASGLQVGAVTVYSGASVAGGTLSSLYRVTGDNEFSSFGAKLSNLGDLDGDGVDDLAVSAALEDIPGGGDALKDAGSVFFLSGADGSLIHRIDGAVRTGNLGSSVTLIPDVDGDGNPEIAIGVPGVDFFARGNGGQVRIYSSADFSLVNAIDLPWVGPGFRLGKCVASVADMDGDGVDDLAAGAPNAFNGQGAVLFLSPVTGDQIGRVLGPSAGVRLGTTCVRLPAPAQERVALGAPENNPGGLHNAGSVFLCDGDSDGDGAPDCLDNCPDFPNPSQLDFDNDGLGDECDPCNDTDGDGFGEFQTEVQTCAQDFCPGVFNLDQTDSDGDGVADACDNCIDFPNPAQAAQDACTSLKTSSFRVRWRKREQTNLFKVTATAEVFDEQVLIAAQSEPMTFEITDNGSGGGVQLFYREMIPGTLKRTSSTRVRFSVSSRLSQGIDRVDLRINRRGRLTLRVNGRGLLTPIGTPVLSVRFGTYNLVVGPKKKKKKKKK